MGRERRTRARRPKTSNSNSRAWNDVRATTKAWPSMADATVLPVIYSRVQDVQFDGTEDGVDASGRRFARLRPSFPLLHPTWSASSRGNEALHLPSSSPGRASAQRRLLPRPGLDKIASSHVTFVGFVVSTPWTVLPVLSRFASVQIGQ